MPPTSSRTIIMSTPLTTSCFNVDAAASCSNTTAGRRLANVPRPARRFRRPRSGRCSGGSWSHLYLQRQHESEACDLLAVYKELSPCRFAFSYPPMAASRTASDSLQICRVSSGSGDPVASTAAPPMCASVNWNSTPSRLPAACNALSATFEISGPMPSPGSTAILQVWQRVRALQCLGSCANLRDPLTLGGSRSVANRKVGVAMLLLPRRLQGVQCRRCGIAARGCIAGSCAWLHYLGFSVPLFSPLHYLGLCCSRLHRV